MTTHVTNRYCYIHIEVCVGGGVGGAGVVKVVFVSSCRIHPHLGKNPNVSKLVAYF